MQNTALKTDSTSENALSIVKPLSRGQKAAATRKRNQEAKAKGKSKEKAKPSTKIESAKALKFIKIATALGDKINAIEGAKFSTWNKGRAVSVSMPSFKAFTTAFTKKADKAAFRAMESLLKAEGFEMKGVTVMASGYVNSRGYATDRK